MSFAAVTARSHGGLTAANTNRPPQKYNVEKLKVSSPASRRRKAALKIPFKKKTFKSIGRVRSAERQPRIVRTRIPAAVSTRGLQTALRQAQAVSLRQIAKLVAQTVSRSTPLSLVTLLTAEYLYNKVVEPNGFPGFDNITEGWRDPHSHHVPGDYVGNPLDIGPNGPPPLRALLDANDTTFFSIRYWGDFAADPYPNPVPGVNWPTVPIWLPNPAILPAVSPVPAYRPLPNLIRPTQTRAQRRARPRTRPRVREKNLEIKIRLPRTSTSPRSSVKISRNVPAVRGKRDGKATPANAFVYAVLLELANAMGETKEWIDILAEAGGYEGQSSAPLQRGHHQTVQKAWFLFIDNGINNIDFDLLAVLVIENEIEDFLIGIAGRMSKSAARALGLTVGPQTGLAL